MMPPSKLSHSHFEVILLYVNHVWQLVWLVLAVVTWLEPLVPPATEYEKVDRKKTAEMKYTEMKHNMFTLDVVDQI